MILTEEQKQSIVKACAVEYQNDIKERKKMGQFFTPAELVIKMIEKFDTKEEAENFYNACNTKVYYFIFMKLRSYLRLLMEYVPYLGDYTHPWTDANLYDYFRLSDDEIAEIEKEIK